MSYESFVYCSELQVSLIWRLFSGRGGFIHVQKVGAENRDILYNQSDWCIIGIANKWACEPVCHCHPNCCSDSGESNNETEQQIESDFLRNLFSPHACIFHLLETHEIDSFVFRKLCYFFFQKWIFLQDNCNGRNKTRNKMCDVRGMGISGCGQILPNESIYPNPPSGSKLGF